MRQTDDLRIRDVRPLISPAILLEEIPISETASNVVADARQAITNIIQGRDPRLLVVVGPCSIHDTKSALEYGERLKPLADRLADRLLIVMRAYFEKPRTSVGWKGLINDPDLDGSFHINKGLRLARQLLLDLNNMGLPTAPSFSTRRFRSTSPTWCRGWPLAPAPPRARFTASLHQACRCPSASRTARTAARRWPLTPILTARSQHWFPSVTKQGVSAIFQTSGNEACHVILRGGSRTGPNYDAEHVAKVAARLAAKGLPEAVMIDCSHGNSLKDHLKQADVATAVCRADHGRLPPHSWGNARKPSGGGPAGLPPRSRVDLRTEHYRCMLVPTSDRTRSGRPRTGAECPKVGK